MESPSPPLLPKAKSNLEFSKDYPLYSLKINSTNCWEKLKTS